MPPLEEALQRACVHNEKMVSQWDKDEEKRELYIEMVITHGSIMLSTGAVTIRGLINLGPVGRCVNARQGA